MNTGFDFILPNGENKRRRYRVRVRGLRVMVAELEDVRLVKNVSSVGLSFYREPVDSFGSEQVLTLDLILDGKQVLQKLSSRVVWLDNELVGCEFVDLGLVQETVLDKLVLEAQKRLIDRYKGRHFDLINF